MVSMTRSLVMSIVLTILLAVASAFVIAPAFAASSLSITIPGAPVFTFQDSPRWVAVPGTQVYTIQGDVRPDYDVFRHGSYTYVYRGGTWYRAKSWNGRYAVVQDRYLPAQLNVVPRERWRAYPPGWEQRAEAHAKNAGKAKGK